MHLHSIGLNIINLQLDNNNIIDIDTTGVQQKSLTNRHSPLVDCIRKFSQSVYE